MFERFTKEARAVVERARRRRPPRSARDRIGAEHLLLGLAAERGGRRGVLDALGLGHEALRGDARATGGGSTPTRSPRSASTSTRCERRVEESFGPGALGRRSPRPAPVLARRRRRRWSWRCARRSRSATAHIGAEHILLGVLRDPGERVGALLRGASGRADACGPRCSRRCRDAA